MAEIRRLLSPRKHQSGQKILKDKYIEWNTFFRYNIDEFIAMYFGIKLHDYQKIQVFLMGNRVSTTIPASRATAKSWICSVFAPAFCTLYPNTKAVIVSPTRGQSNLMVASIDKLAKAYPNLGREIRKIKNGKDESKIEFFNGSEITVVAVGEGGRGYRANLIIVEEAASVKKKMLDEIVMPFAFQRPAPFRQKKRYRDIQEITKKIYIGSIKDKTNWFYTHCLQQMLISAKGDPMGILKPNQVIVLTLDYMTSLYHKIKTKQDIMNDRITFDNTTWQHEYLNIPSSDSETAFFTRSMFERNQVLTHGWYPATPLEFSEKKYQKLPREGDEMRIISMDIALSATTKKSHNDLSSVECFRVFPRGEKGMLRKQVYLETYAGANTKEQAIRIRQVMEDFDADVLVLDCKGVGKGVYDILTDELYDDIRGVTYPPIRALYHSTISPEVYNDLTNRSINSYAKEMIYPFIGTDKSNSSMWFTLRDNLRQEKVQLLISELDAENKFAKSMQADWLADEHRRARLLMPYRESGMQMSEAISLEQKITAGLIKLVEKPKARKDRIVSLGMANFYINILEMEYLQSFNNEDYASFIAKINRTSAGGTNQGIDVAKEIFE